MAKRHIGKARLMYVCCFGRSRIVVTTRDKKRLLIFHICVDSWTADAGLVANIKVSFVFNRVATISQNSHENIGMLSAVPILGFREWLASISKQFKRTQPPRLFFLGAEFAVSQCFCSLFIFVAKVVFPPCV